MDMRTAQGKVECVFPMIDEDPCTARVKFRPNDQTHPSLFFEIFL